MTAAVVVDRIVNKIRRENIKSNDVFLLNIVVGSIIMMIFQSTSGRLIFGSGCRFLRLLVHEIETEVGKG